MSELSGQGMDRALSQARIAIMPTASDAGVQSLATTKSFGPFDAGDEVIVSSTGAFHLIAGASGLSALTTHPVFPAGVYKMAIPNGCTHVAMIQSAAGAASGQATKG